MQHPAKVHVAEPRYEGRQGGGEEAGRVNEWSGACIPLLEWQLGLHEHVELR